MPYSKHTNMELLAECYNCISDLLELSEIQPKAEALRDEIGKRTKGVTFITDDASALQVEEPEMRVCTYCGKKHIPIDKPTFRTDSVEGDRYRRDEQS